MKKSIIKRALASILSVMMIVTSVPIAANAATVTDSNSGFQWEEIASTDFKAKNRVWTKNNNSSSHVHSMNKESDDKLGWNVCRWDKDFVYVTDDTAEGISIDDGYMWLTDYNGTKTFPVNETENFKIDIEFSYYAPYTVNTAGKYCFVKLTTNTDGMNSNDKPSKNMQQESFFSQDAYGRNSVNNNIVSTIGDRNGNEYGVNHSIDTNSLEVGKTYHYQIKYINGFITGDVLDENGKVVVYGGCGHTVLTPDNIHGMYLGDDNNSDYLHNLTYKSVSFYKGTSVGEKKVVDHDKDKYLFAYFTGNTHQHIRLAVSDDGYNFESLNGNRSVVNSSPNACYPSSTANTGIAASNNARDPYIFPKQNGNGYYMIATDLNINASTGYANSKLLVWDVDNLGNIGDVRPWNVETCDWFANYDKVAANNDFYAWAPQAIWDDQANMYMLYWTSSAIYNDGSAWRGYNEMRVYYAYTDDFKTFYIDAEKSKECGKGTNPKMLFDYDFTSIDADITYDGRLYYMYFKHEGQKEIYYAVSDCASGPYAGPKKFFDSDYGKFSNEGCQVYQLYDGSYNLVTDCYTESNGQYTYDGFFAVFNSKGGLTNFENNNTNSSTIFNYLTPRHGAVVNITTEEYNALINKYGKVTFDSNGIRDDSQLNIDHLVARYFVDSDLTKDATGHGYTLTTNNALTFGTDSERGGYAKFTQANGSYAMVNTSQMLADYNINAKDGVTFDWYGYIDAPVTEKENTYSRYFELTSATAPNQFTGSNFGSYLFYGVKNGYEVSDGSTITNCWGWSNAYHDSGRWYHYTLTISDGYACAFINNKLLNKRFIAKDINDVANRIGADGTVGGSSSSGSPTHASLITDTWLKDLFKGNLMIGASSYNDPFFDGRISDFRIYNAALYPNEVQNSVYKLKNDLPGRSLTNFYNDAVFYDPMCDKTATVNGNLKTYQAYPNTIDDPITVDHDNSDVTAEVPVHEKILNTAPGQTESHDTIYSDGLNKKYGATIGFGLYLPAASTGIVFSIGSDFYMTAAGKLFFKGNCILDNCFSANSLAPWQHITIQLVQDEDFESVYVYSNADDPVKVNLDGARDSENRIYNYIKTTNKNSNVTYGQFDGGVSDFIIYNGCFSAYSCYSWATVIHATTMLPRGLHLYVNNMKYIAENKLLYKNMAPAYEAYDKAKRYIDSVNFGNVQPDRLTYARLYVELRTAMNNMELYTEPTTYKGLTSYQTGLANDIDPIFTQNLISAPVLNNLTELKTATNGNTVVALAAPSIAWLYDGETLPTAPIIAYAWAHKSKDTSWGQHYYKWLADIYNEGGTDRGNMQFGGLGAKNTYQTDDCYWYFYNTGGDTAIKSRLSNPEWHYEKKNDSNIVKVDYRPNYDPSKTNYVLEIAGRGLNAWEMEYKYGANYISYQGGAAKFTNNGSISDYLYSFNPQYRYTYVVDTTIQNLSDIDWTRVSPTYYVLNYKAVKDVLFKPEILSRLAEITSVSKKDAIGFVKAYDALTGMNFLMEQTNQTTVENIAQQLKTNVDKLKDFETASLIDNADYSQVVDTAAREKEIIDKGIVVPGEDGKNTRYTFSSWGAYTGAVDDIYNHFEALNPYGANHDYDDANEQYKIDALQNAVEAAKAELVVIADFKPVDLEVKEKTETYEAGLEDESGEQKYAYGTWNDFETAYDYAHNLSLTDTPTRRDTPKFDVTNSAYDSQDVSTWTADVESAEQKDIRNAAANVETTNAALAAPADYAAYDAAVDLLKYQDVGAFTDTYLNSDTSVYGLIRSEGTKNKTATYANGATSQNVLCETPAYNGTQTAYVTADVDVNGTIVQKVYKNTPISAQSALDSKAGAVLTAVTDANNSTEADVRRSFTVTFKINDTVQSETTCWYGNVSTFEVPEGSQCYKWTIDTTAGGGTRVDVKGSQAYTYSVQSDAVITAYTESVDTENFVKVKLVNIYGELAHESLVANDGTYTIDVNNIPNKANVPFYNLTGWTVNGKALPDNTTSFAVADYAENGIVTVRPVYQPVSATQRAGAYNITLNGTDVAPGRAIVFDTRLNLKADEGIYAIAALIDGKYYPVSYTPNYTFYATGSVEFVTITQNEDGKFVDNNNNEITDSETVRKLSAKLPFIYSTADMNGDSFVTYGAPTLGGLGETVQVTEMGTLYTTNTDASAEDTFVLENSSVKHITAKHPNEISSQFFLKINKVGSRYVATRSYVKYIYTMPDGTKLQCIDYSNITKTNG